jgi:uncharacterized protein (DUF362 family)
MSELSVASVKKDCSDQELIDAIKSVLLSATDNLSFLKPGETVLLKPAINSPGAYPATTHPLALKAVAEALVERGAKVLAGDQSGIEHVVQNETGVLKGSSRQNYSVSGLAGSGVEFKAFEEGDWEKDFFLFKDDQTKSWTNGFYLTSQIKKVDHIINLPRLSTHALAGVTLGFKNLVGLLRQDSRLEFHADGPFYDVLAGPVKKHLKTDYHKQDKFIEKIAEISLAIKDKLRATLFVATKAQTAFGPDRELMGLLKAPVVEPEEGLVFASADPVAAELFAISFLTLLYREQTPRAVKFFENLALLPSRKYHHLHDQAPRANLFIKRSKELGLGDDNPMIDWNNVSVNIKNKLEKLLAC